jgi:preprotein translocase subunit SecE
MFDKIKQFFTDVKAETKKVVFPGKDELIGSTWVVLITVFIISIYLGVVDLGLAEIVKALIK